MPNKNTIASAIADYLFKNGNGTPADRLLLIVEDYPGKAKVIDAQYLGGWSKAAVRDAISCILESDTGELAQRKGEKS